MYTEADMVRVWQRLAGELAGAGGSLSTLSSQLCSLVYRFPVFQAAVKLHCCTVRCGGADMRAGIGR